MEIMNNKIFQCSYCLEKSSEARRQSFGCKKYSEEPNKLPIKHFNEIFRFYTCVGNFYDQSVQSLLFIKEQFDKGVMPYGGSLMEQPAKFIEAMELIDVTRNRIAKESSKNGK